MNTKVKKYFEFQIPISEKSTVDKTKLFHHGDLEVHYEAVWFSKDEIETCITDLLYITEDSTGKQVKQSVLHLISMCNYDDLDIDFIQDAIKSNVEWQFAGFEPEYDEPQTQHLHPVFQNICNSFFPPITKTA